MSEDSLATSTAIFAAPYAVLQPDSLDDPGSSAPVSEGSGGGQPIDRAMEPDEATSALGFLALERILATSFVMNSIGDLGVGGGLFRGVDDADEDFLRK